MNKKLGLFASLWAFMGCVVLSAQTRANNYIYDEAGQLIGAINENGNVAAYNYDAVGNLTSIERLTARGPVDVFFVVPNRGRAAVAARPGTTVTIHGLGFSAVAAENQVTFNGASAVVNSSTTTMIKTTVPAGATTGPVRVRSPLGMATSRSDFMVVNIAIMVSPARVNVGTGQRQQFTATVTEGGRPIPGNVVWSVNGIVGGNPTVGTINTNGLYTAPGSIPSPPTVTVAATSVEEPTARASAMVRIFGESIIIPYSADNYRYRIVPFGQITPGFERFDFDDSGFSLGNAAFGFGGCLPFRTNWPPNTEIMLRKKFILPAGVSNLRVGAAIDNDIQVFINGVDISDGLRLHEGCAARDSFIFRAPDGILRVGENLVAVRGRDRGGATYVDIEMRALIPPTQ